MIFIAIITVNTMSDVIGLGSGMDETTARLTLHAQKIAITEYVVSDYQTRLTVKNNHINSVFVTDIIINNENCSTEPSGNIQLRNGQKKFITCTNVYETKESRVEYPIEINWQDITTQARYTQKGSDLVLVGQVV